MLAESVCGSRPSCRVAAVYRRRSAALGAHALCLFGQATNDTIPVIPTGFADLDATLGISDIVRGRITELLGNPTSGMSAAILTLMARVQGDVVAYLDLSRTFDLEYVAA